MEPITQEYVGNDPLAYVIDCNRERRHETLAERATAAAKLANLTQGRKVRETPVGVSLPAVTNKQAAKLLNVGKGSIDRARAVLANGSPELVDQMSLCI